MRIRSLALSLTPAILALSCSTDNPTAPGARALKSPTARSIVTTEIDGYSVDEFFTFAGAVSYGITGNGDLVGSWVIGDANINPEQPAFFPADGSNPTQFECC